MRVRVKPDDKRRDGGLRKKKQGGGQEAEGVETEQKKRKRGRERGTGLRPNAGRHKCLRDVVKQASSQPTYQHSSPHCIYREMRACLRAGLYAGADSRHLLI